MKIAIKKLINSKLQAPEARVALAILEDVGLDNKHVTHLGIRAGYFEITDGRMGVLLPARDPGEDRAIELKSGKEGPVYLAHQVSAILPSEPGPYRLELPKDEIRKALELYTATVARREAEALVAYGEALAAHGKAILKGEAVGEEPTYVSPTVEAPVVTAWAARSGSTADPVQVGRIQVGFQAHYLARVFPIVEGQSLTMRGTHALGVWEIEPTTGPSFAPDQRSRVLVMPVHLKDQP